MNSEAMFENKRTLQELIGMNSERAEKILGSSILITVSGEHPRLIEFLMIILGKTFQIVHDSPKIEHYSCEIISNSSQKKTEGPYIYLGQKSNGNLIVSADKPDKNLSEENHTFLYFLLACYTGALILRKLSNNLPFHVANEIIIDANILFGRRDLIDNVLNIEKAFLVGAGAVGNSFLYALSTFQIEGEITIVDPDYISGGNLNRCLFFNENDISKNKVDVLSFKAQNLFPGLKLIPEPNEFAKISDKPEGAWLNKLIVAVDSRRARRNLQNEIPYEVFDASTTGIEEVVIHHHQIPLSGTACLGCIYVRESQENAHEIHIASALGVSVTQIQKQFIDEEAGKAICSKYTDIDLKDIIGIPFDTLFKELCGEGKLMTSESKQVLAPLAFVSALAGAFLALMIVEKHYSNSLSYNYWRISPWSNLNFKLKQMYLTNINCEFCNNAHYMKISEEMWKNK